MNNVFFDGDKMDVWKADMDGEVDCSSKDIKDAIIKLEGEKDSGYILDFT